MVNVRNGMLCESFLKFFTHTLYSLSGKCDSSTSDPLCECFTYHTLVKYTNICWGSRLDLTHSPRDRTDNSLLLLSSAVVSVVVPRQSDQQVAQGTYMNRESCSTVMHWIPYMKLQDIYISRLSHSPRDWTDISILSLSSAVISVGEPKESDQVSSMHVHEYNSVLLFWNWILNMFWK